MQTMGSRAVRSAARLHWSILVEVFDGEANVKEVVDALRGSADEELIPVIELADRYLSGWRPSEWGDE